uniref:SRCR domain-containing protein n=1 Tax=Cairina moschata TaxID=8855 RepID=A0A8C3GIP4_CAIMO
TPPARGVRPGNGAATPPSPIVAGLLRLAGGSSSCSGHLEVLREGTWGRVCANGTSPATAAVVCRQLGCGTGGRLAAVPAQGSVPAWLGGVRCQEGAPSLWRCPSAPWHLQACGPEGVAHIACDEDTEDTSGATSTAGSSCRHGDACLVGSAHAHCPLPPAPAAVRIPASRCPSPSLQVPAAAALPH